MSTIITVKVAKVGTKTVEVTLQTPTTVKEALALAEVSSEGFTMTVNGVPAQESTAITADAVIFLSQKIKGGC